MIKPPRDLRCRCGAAARANPASRSVQIRAIPVAGYIKSGVGFAGGHSKEVYVGKSIYRVSIVRRGDEDKWDDFWASSPSKGEDPARHIHKEARNLEEAIRSVQAENPGFTVIRKGSGKIGG